MTTIKSTLTGFICSLLVLSATIAYGQSPTASSDGYSIIKSTSMGTVKRSVDVRLDKKVSKQNLVVYAGKIKSLERGKYDLTFITFYLPGMRVGSGAWATTHFNPNLEVKILGLT